MKQIASYSMLISRSISFLTLFFGEAFLIRLKGKKKKYWRELRNLERTRKRSLKRINEVKKTKIGKTTGKIYRNDTRVRKSSIKEIRIEAPRNFSFVNNPNECLDYLKNIRSIYRNGNRPIIDLEAIESLTSDAIVLLLAHISNKKITRGLGILGNDPKNKELHQILIDSGFYDKMLRWDGTRYEKTDLIFQEEKQQVDNQIVDKTVEYLRNKMGLDARRAGRTRGFIQEVMTNTYDHASKNKFQSERERWFLAARYCSEAKKASFSLIDLGVGIFKSVPKTWKEKLGSVPLSNLFNRQFDNTDLMGEILRGDRESSTGLSYRGTGLPGLYDGLKRGNIDRLVIAANDTMTDIGKDVQLKFTTLSPEFSGTLIYWEIEDREAHHAN